MWQSKREHPQSRTVACAWISYACTGCADRSMTNDWHNQLTPRHHGQDTPNTTIVHRWIGMKQHLFMTIHPLVTSGYLQMLCNTGQSEKTRRTIVCRC